MLNRIYRALVSTALLAVGIPFFLAGFLFGIVHLFTLAGRDTFIHYMEIFTKGNKQ